MKIKHIPALAVIAAVPVLGVTAPAVAHDGNHPFENCSEAYDNDYSNIPSTDRHYAKKLDRDGDGFGCDDQVKGNDGKDKTGYYGGPSVKPSEKGKDTDDKALAETGGDSKTPFIAGAGALLLIGGGALAFRRKRQN